MDWVLTPSKTSLRGGRRYSVSEPSSRELKKTHISPVSGQVPVPTIHQAGHVAQPVGACAMSAMTIELMATGSFEVIRTELRFPPESSVVVLSSACVVASVSDYVFDKGGPRGDVQDDEETRRTITATVSLADTNPSASASSYERNVTWPFVGSVGVTCEDEHERKRESPRACIGEERPAVEEGRSLVRDRKRVRTGVVRIGSCRGRCRSCGCCCCCFGGRGRGRTGSGGGA